MKKLSIIIAAMIVATGLTTHAQILVLSDSFDTGGVATNDMLYNLVARQAGTAAPNNLNTAVPEASMLTAGGELHLIEGGIVFTDYFAPQVGNHSFNIEVTGRQDAGSANWTALTLGSEFNDSWETSPMSVILYNNDWIWVFYGTATNTIAAGTDLYIGLSPDTISLALGTNYSKADLHTFEMRATAESATNGTWSFYIDGIPLTTGLPYQFEDPNLRMSWWGGGAGADSSWSDWSISTIPEPTQEYVFFDNFNVSDHTDANWKYGTRRTAGTVSIPFTTSPELHSIVDGKVHNSVNGSGLNIGIDLASYIVGNDFDFSVKVANKETGPDWGSIYLYSNESPGRGGSHIGCLIWGAAQGTAFSLYSGVGPDVERVYGVSVAALAAEFGSWSAADEHTIQFISHAGPGETNTYDFVVDGVTMVGNIPYRIPGVTRKIGMIGIPKALGLYYDDLYLKVLKGITYEDWVVDDTSLTVGVNDARTDDPDEDTMENLLEYALGGNPMVDDAASILPTSEFAPDTIEYVYRRRVDAATRGLVYDVVINIDGLQLPWTNVGNGFETDTGPIDFEFESVTNVLGVTGIDLGFLNLEVTEN